MKIPVKVNELTEKVEEAFKAAQEEETRRTQEYERARLEFRKKVASALRTALEKVEAGEFDDSDDWFEQADIKVRGGEVSVAVDGRSPSQPRLEIWRIERDLEALRRTNKETLNIGPDDHLWKYLAKPEER